MLDASCVATFLFKDEATPATEQLYRDALRHGVVVPALWPLEIANLLRQAERRGRIASQDIPAALSRIRLIPAVIEPPSLPAASGPVLHLARKHSLTAYDAAYLELALRLGLPLASKDAELVAAAAAEGVALLTP